MNIQPINNINFGILKGVKPREYGEYMWGEYKGYKIEVYDAYKSKQKLIYIADKVGRFFKSKLFYLQNGVKKVTRSEGLKNDRQV